MTRLNGMRVAIVEDDPIIAMSLREALEGAGAEVVYEAHDLPGALSAAALDDVDAAVFDVNLNGRPSFPAAALFARNGVPIVFATAYGRGVLPGDMRRAPLVRKPYGDEQMIEALNRVMAATATRTTPHSD